MRWKSFTVEDIVGKRFGDLIVVEFIRSVSGKPFKYYYKCKCDCGNEVEVLRSNLVTKHTKSCGCRKNLHGEQSKSFKGYKDISSAFWTKTKIGALRRELPFEISIEYGWSLFEEQKGLCKLTGLPIRFVSRKMQKYLGEATASLDRIDSKKGYVEGNVQWVHKDINQIKWDLDQDRFIELCVLVANYKII